METESRLLEFESPNTPRDHHANPRQPLSTAERSPLHREEAMPGGRMDRRRGRNLLLLSLLATVPLSEAADCISLKGSTQCPAFSSASVSTSKNITDLYPFMAYVSSTSSFDSQLAAYVKTSYIQLKYQTLLGCTNVDLTNTTELYAQYTTSVICNGIIQNSKSICGLSDQDSEPLCAASCALFAESEEKIVAVAELCNTTASGSAIQSQIRADYTNCGLPTNALTGSCIEGITNEPANCGFGNSTFGLCEYCSSGGENSTDTCCYNSNASTRCAGVVLPSITATMTFPTATVTATSSPGNSRKSSGLSTGAKAGIAIGAIIGFLILIALIAFLIFCCRKRRAQSSHGSVFNQPTPPRKPTGTAMASIPATGTATRSQQGYEALPGGRIARMSALESTSRRSPPRSNIAEAGSAAAAGAIGGYAAGRSRNGRSSSSEFGESPRSVAGAVLRPPATSRRQGSLSSNSALGSIHDHSSPASARDVSSPPPGGAAIGSQQSEQLAYFKDYYSQDEIHPGSKVATLWAYQPRAADEFALERGDMLKVVGIWDDGWATGVMLDEKAEEWDEKRKMARDSGLGGGGEQSLIEEEKGLKKDVEEDTSDREIKAFPLVCVCLPEHWKKTIEGDASTESGSQLMS